LKGKENSIPHVVREGTAVQMTTRQKIWLIWEYTC